MRIGDLRLTCVLAASLLLVGCSCGETDNVSKEQEGSSDPVSVTVTLPPNGNGEKTEEQAEEYSYEPVGTPKPDGLYNDPDTDATPEPKLSYEEYRAMNKDVIGWITVPNTTIDYPVLHCDTNYYINHSPTRTRSDYGSVYLYEQCERTDRYRIIFGHAMKDGSMFAPLHNFSDREFFSNTPTFTLTDGDEKQTYRIFSAFVTDVDVEYPMFMTLGLSGKEYVAFLEELQDRSLFAVEGITFDENSRVVCLVTCNRVSYANGREIVLGVLQAD